MMLLIKSEPSSLDDHLLNRPYPPLSWRRMLQTTIGAAPGLDFDHEGVREVKFFFWTRTMQDLNL